MKIGDAISAHDVSVLLSALERQYQHYTELAMAALEKKNMPSNLVHASAASAFGRSKWMVEDWLDAEATHAGEVQG